MADNFVCLGHVTLIPHETFSTKKKHVHTRVNTISFHTPPFEINCHNFAIFLLIILQIKINITYYSTILNMSLNYPPYIFSYKRIYF